MAAIAVISVYNKEERTLDMNLNMAVLTASVKPNPCRDNDIEMHSTSTELT